MKEEKFKKGQVVYIQGIYKAKILEIYDDSIHCLVYEGIPDEKPSEYTYGPDLIETKQKMKVEY